jgi:hypothetical protein
LLCEIDRAPVLEKPAALFQSMNWQRLSIDNDYDENNDETRTKIYIIRAIKNLMNS